MVLWVCLWSVGGIYLVRLRDVAFAPVHGEKSNPIYPNMSVGTGRVSPKPQVNLYLKIHHHESIYLSTYQSD